MNKTVRSIFISYARRDALKFARRLESDLREAGHKVFMDLTDIEEGGVWDVRLEEGIRCSDFLAAVMTADALRPDSVCRDEVVFAFNEGKSVVPLKLDPSPDFRPPILLARRNWIDFSANYDSGLQSLLGHLGGDPSALQHPPVPTVTGLVPLDFGPEIARLTKDFTGRIWLDTELERWLNSGRGRAFIVIGEPGIGKSAIAAWLSTVRSEQTIAVHFCTDRNSRTLDPFEFVASLVGQLSTQVSGFGESVALRQPEIRRPLASDAFRELVLEPARQSTAPANPLLVVVDSLDEALRKQGETLLDVLVSQAEDLPSWLRIVATTRPDQQVLQKIRRLYTFELRADGAGNLSDLSQYINNRLANLGRQERLPKKSVSLIAARLPDLANGNFLYARMALDALEDGTLSEKELDELSPGISDFYSKTFLKLFPEDSAFEVDGQPIIRALTVAMAPVPFVILDRISRQAEESEETTHKRLLRLRSYLRVFGKGGEGSTYALFHKSLGDWLNDPEAAGSWWCAPRIGMAELADACWQDYANDPERMTEYTLRYAMFHLRAVRRHEDAKTLSQDETFRRRRSQLGLGSFFLCYAREDDEPFASQLHRDLTSRGFDIWFDREDLPSRGRSFLREVQEGIDQYDRLVLVVGPKALTSDYVRAEWQHALTSGKAVMPILRLGEFTDLPSELSGLNVHDFREPARYDAQLDEFVRSVVAPLPPLGALLGVPSLPPGFVALPDHIHELKDAILYGRARYVTTGIWRIVGVTGMGGIGKTVLLSAFARDPEVRRAFPDGIFWITIGRDPDLVGLQRKLASYLRDSWGFTTCEEGRERLDLLLADRRVLLILDDVWETDHTQAFSVRGGPCRTALTTRIFQVIRELGGIAVTIGSMSETDAITLLALGAGTSVEKLPPEVREVARECDGHPLALSLVSSMVRRGLPWGKVRDRLRRHFLESVEPREAWTRGDSVLLSIKLSYESLNRSEQERLVELAATFVEGQSIEEPEIFELWEKSEGMSELESSEVLSALSDRGLINLHQETTDRWLVTLHPLVHQFLRTISR